jgi:hypothetical protein
VEEKIIFSKPTSSSSGYLEIFVLIRLFIAMTNTYEKQFKRANNFVVFFIAHGHLAPCFWACGEAEHHGEVGLGEQTAHL